MRLDKDELIDMVVDKGKTHFAINGDYAGSIDTYNNVLTQTAAYTSGKAVTITVNGEKLCANIDSLRKFMLENQADDFRSIEELKDLSSYQFNVLPLDGEKRFMAAHISQNTKNLLSKELFKAIATHNPSLAERKIRQGAELNTHAWLNENTSEIYLTKHFTTLLRERNFFSPLDVKSQRFTQATPFILALRLNQIGVATLILDHLADTSLTGQTLIFSRQWARSYNTEVCTDWFDEIDLMVYNSATKKLDYIPKRSSIRQQQTTHTSDDDTTMTNS